MSTHRHIQLRSGLRRSTLAALLLVSLLPAAVAVESVPDGVETAYEVDEDEGRAPRPKWENAPAVAATFLRDTYRPGTTATWVLWHREGRLTLQIFRSGPEDVSTDDNITMQGVPVTATTAVAPHAAHTPIRLRVGDWPSGLYFARLTASDGRIGYAPFVVAPKRLGEHRVLVVLSTYTWQAYNFRDDDGDGVGDTWYADWKRPHANLARPFMGRGVPAHFYLYELPFLQWLAHSDTHRAVDYFSDADLDRVRGDALAQAYDLIVFPGHHEYVTTREFDATERYRDLGGNLMFLSANNFFWKTVLKGNTMSRLAKWRDVGRPEAALIGVGFIGTDEGVHRGSWIVRDGSQRWLFRGTAVKRGMAFGNAGIEIDHTSPASPRGTHVIAEIPHLFGKRFTAQMTYYETPAGAKVFAAGAFTIAGSLRRPEMEKIVSNLWTTLSRP